MQVELLKEPNLEFGNDFVCDDPKMGISVGGFFSKTTNTHRTELHYAILGTKKDIEATQTWVGQFESYIEATGDEETNGIDDDVMVVDGEVLEVNDDDDSEGLTLAGLFELNEPEQEKTKGSNIINKRLNPDFPGFNERSPFSAKFVNDETNNKSINSAQLDSIVNDKDLPTFDKIVRICDLYVEQYNALIERSIAPAEVCFVVIPSGIAKKFSSFPFKGNKYFNLRRYLKALLLSVKGAIPVQIILEDTILSKKKSLQDLSMQAWNFCVANYYKNNGTPWSLTLKDKYTCFIGISFHKVLSSEENATRASVAQAFNYEGKGIIFVGDKFEWDAREMKTPAPHLEYDYAKRMIQQVIEEYKLYNRSLPRRVVVHKTTDFWDSNIHEDYAEVEGLKDGIRYALGDNVEIDLVTVKSSEIKLLRKSGNFPVIRGTLLHVDESTGILYTTGYVPYYETFPSGHIPHPLEINIYESESSLKQICEEILALTKMNFNNCNYYSSIPITLRFAQKVGEITQYLDEGVNPPNKYQFYM